ncbi:putative membrane protein [Lewinella marina]|nr:DUF2231 domain-containing protein [Neolewinella marina]NJB86783.1 putative membrane protein [Neolewinella marina]
MNAADLHLILNHFPIIGAFFGVAFMGYGYYTKNETILSAAKVVFIFIALMTIPVYFTGEPAEHAVEELGGFSHDQIHEHEDAAVWGFVAVLIVGALSGFSLWKQRNPGWLNAAILVAGLITLAIMAYVGYEGGQIRHQELQEAAIGQ